MRVTTILLLCLAAAAVGLPAFDPPLPTWFTPTAALPDLLVFNNGSAVTSAAAWEERKSEVKELFFEWVGGAPPNESPALLSASVVNRTVETVNGAISTFWRLSFDTANNATCFVETIEPITPRPGEESSMPRELGWWLVRTRGWFGSLFQSAHTPLSRFSQCL